MFPEIIGKSVCGSKHIEAGDPCQDNWNGDVAEEYLLTCVADGLGSSDNSAVGSELAVNAAVSRFQDWVAEFDGEIATVSEEVIEELYSKLYSAARTSLMDRAESEGDSLDEYHTTLSIVFATPDWYAAGAVGDSGLVGIDPTGHYKKLVAREESSTASATVPITASASLIEDRKRFNFERSPVAAVVSFSDGFDRFAWAKNDSSKPRTKFFNRISRFITGVDSFNDSDARRQFGQFVESEVFKQHSSDDKTLVVGRFPSNISSQLVESPAKQEYDDAEFIQAVRDLPDGEASISAIANKVGCSQTTASNRLSTLEVLGDVESESDDTKIIWRVAGGNER